MVQANHALSVAEAAKSHELANLRALKAAQARVKRSSRPPAAASGSRAVSCCGRPSVRSTQGVGPRIHPVYGYASCHTGIDIGAGYGSTISAALGGTVIAEYFNTAYGNVTLIDHGNGLATFYAHQSACCGSKPAVKQGHVIGFVGSTGYSTGPHLHFEVHVNGVPYDPMGWFGGAKKPVSCA